MLLCKINKLIREQANLLTYDCLNCLLICDIFCYRNVSDLVVLLPPECGGGNPRAVLLSQLLRLAGQARLLPVMRVPAGVSAACCRTSVQVLTSAAVTDTTEQARLIWFASIQIETTLQRYTDYYTLQPQTSFEQTAD